MSTSEWALFLLEVNIMPPKRAREYTQKNCGMCILFYALKFRINFNNKKMCMRTSWTSTVGGRLVNKLNLSSLYHFLNWIYLFIFLLASFMVEFLDCLHKSQADKLYLNFWGIFTRLKWMKCHSSSVCNLKY